MEDADVYNIEPRQSASRSSQPASILSSGDFLQPAHRKRPVLRLRASEVGFLVVKVGCNVMTHERKETCDRVGLIAISYESKVGGVTVKDVAEKGGGGVNGYHGQNADYVHLFVWTMIVESMH